MNKFEQFLVEFMIEAKNRDVKVKGSRRASGDSVNSSAPMDKSRNNPGHEDRIKAMQDAANKYYKENPDEEGAESHREAGPGWVDPTSRKKYGRGNKK